MINDTRHRSDHQNCSALVLDPVLGFVGSCRFNSDITDSFEYSHSPALYQFFRLKSILSS